ncbi:GNAT family N-acetyltransferase [Polymorphospora sp. NPDC050346]|uniref:GNAT family N-acetyltransferase n=1 Tax=Polymorphospora sp. NPDC050346 TaxID=3155780 RepID=UPI0033DD50F4
MVTVRLEPMTDEQYLRYRQRAEVTYAEHIVASGAMPEPEARKKARDDYERLLPAGLRTPDHHLWAAYDGPDEIGMLWLHVERRSDGLHAFGYDFEVRAELRRKGYGRAMIEAVEQVCRDLGVLSIGLSVFGFNLGARALYEQMGYETTAIRMHKRL